MRRISALLFPLSLAFLVVTKAAEWTSEAWWFGALDQGATWRHLMAWRAGGFAVVGLVWAAILGLNVRAAWRHALAQRAPLSLLGGAMEGIELEISPALRLGRQLAQMSVWGAAWLAGLAAANRFDLWVLASRSGARELDAGHDLGFFLFRLPALEWAWGCLGLALGLTFTGCLCLYLWLDTIETGPGVLRASAFARAHLSGLGAALVVWKGGDCALGVLGAPVVFGWAPAGILGFPEQIAGVPASQFFAWSALPIAALALWAGLRDRGRVALFTTLIWGVLALLTPTMAPALVRSLGITNDARQRQAVTAHLEATRRAWGFNRVTDARVSSDAAFAPTQLGLAATATPPTGDNVNRTNVNRADDASVGTSDNAASALAPGAPMVLWPLDAAREALQSQVAASAPSLRVTRVHVARAGNVLQLHAIAARRDAPNAVPALEVRAQAAQPGPLRLSEQRIDENLLSEAGAPASNNRLGPAPDPLPPLPVYRATSQTSATVERASLGACLVLAARFFDPQLLGPGLPLAWHLEPVERAQTLAPFVNWSGAVARPVVLESGVGLHVYWIVEGCFTSRNFPGAATLTTGENWSGVNYARQGVAAIFDGTTGQSQLLLTAPDEPLARAWARALPDLWTPLDELRPELRAALRPSPALLDATTRVYASYHPQDGDEVTGWQSGTSQWRPIATGEEISSPQWRPALLATAGNATPGDATLGDGLKEWQLCAFAAARGTVATGSAPVALTAIVGAALAPDGRAQWQQWRPDRALPLPELAQEPTSVFNPDGSPSIPPPTRIGVFPAFSAQGRPNGFTLFRAEVTMVATQTAAPPGSASQKPSPQLRVRAVTTGTPTRSAPDTAPALGSLARAGELWRAILSARRASKWQDAAQLEAQLGATLSAPAPKPAPERAAQ